MAEVMGQQGAALTAPPSRQDIVSELLDDYTYEDSYDAESVSSLAPAFKELPPPPRTDSLRDPKAEAIQRMNTKFQLREDDISSISSHGSRNGSLDHTPRTRITSRSLSRSGTPPSLNLFVSNGATAYIPPAPLVYPPVQTLPSSIIPDSKELPPPPPERSTKRKELQAATMGHTPSKSELERNDSFHSQSGDKPSGTGPSETAAAVPAMKRKAVPGSGVKKFVSLLELNSGPRGGKPAPAPTSAPRETGTQQEVASKTPIPNEVSTNDQLPPTPPEEHSIPSPPRKALVGVGLPSNPRTKQPMSPLHTRGKSSTCFNILKAQRPAPPVPTTRKEVTTPEPTPSPTLKPEIRMDNEISPIKPLPSPTDARRPFSYEGPGSHEQGSPKQKTEQKAGEGAQLEVHKATQSLTPATVLATPASQPSLPLRTTTLDPPSPSPSLRPSTAPAPQSTFTTTHPFSSTSTLPFTTTHPSSSTSTQPNAQEPSPSDPAQHDQGAPFIPLTKLPIPLPPSLIPRITPSQLACYTRHATNVWSNNFFQPTGCMACGANTPERRFQCTWCQLRICRGCSDVLRAIPGRDLGVLLEARQSEREREQERERERESEGEDSEAGDAHSGVKVVVHGVDQEVRGYGDEEDGSEGRGRGLEKVDSRERSAGSALRE
ncbi:uncharacterized protein M421DRAFT_411 [Didymella exigua CBS 183.55]|uniref:Uncharacterized protein n=1 Tax=Didymella exigua CBS 183.55 TaxID=1150837 RepID=A0A6A5S3S2_9PLEO|nr:uncharacterized protein M421DRAFT_411 [Didymella exigua CBS 183.55]KAF1934270.1 hypothetical protein M421DRAFT_411 [Didymella exigua CBS 183.55]